MLQVRGLLLATATDFARRQHLHHHCAQHDPSMTGKHQDQPVLPRTFLEIMESCGFSQLPEVTQKSSLEVQFSVASPPTSITVLFGACRRFWSNQSFAMHMTTKCLLHSAETSRVAQNQETVWDLTRPWIQFLHVPSWYKKLGCTSCTKLSLAVSGHLQFGVDWMIDSRASPDGLTA